MAQAQIDARKLWIHCNRCFALYVEKKFIFFLLACQHVTCEKCVKTCLGRTPSDAPTYTCPICNKAVRGRQVDNTMPNNLKHLFHPEPWLDGLPYESIYAFQMAHKKHFEKFTNGKKEEVSLLTKKVSLAREACRKLYLEKQVVHMNLKHMQHRMRLIKYQRKQQALARRAAKRCASVQPSSAIQHHRPLRPSSVPTVITGRQQHTATITSFHHNPNHSFEL